MNLQRIRRLPPPLLLVITALGLLRPPEIFAADPGGLDLVVLVDQSGSMSGHGTPVKNDPYNVRNHMVAFTLDLMAENAVLNQVIHRLGVVSFGTTVRVDLPLAELTPKNLETLRDSVGTIPSKESLGYTNFLAAFQAAAKMFADPSPDPERKRTILVITDGAPYVEGVRLDEYQDEVRRFAIDHFPHEDYLIWMVALNDPTSDYWDRYRVLWREITDNHAKKLEGDENDIFAALHEVVTELVQTRVVQVVEEEIIIPPYLESIVFDIFSVDPRVRVEIFSPGDPDTPLPSDSPGVKVVYIGEIIRSVTVRRPDPGPWTVRKSHPNARVDVFNQQFFPRGKLTQPAQELRQYDPVAVAYQVVDGDGEPIRELEGYPLRLDLTLVKPDDARLRLAMERAPELGEAVFRTVDETQCDLPGRYRTEVLVSAKDLRDVWVTLFQDAWSGFEVRRARRLECRIEAPREGERLPLFGRVVFWPRPVTTRFAFVDEKEQPFNLAALFGSHSPGDLIRLRLERGNEELAPKVNLQDLGGGILEGEIDAWLGSGEFRLRPRADRTLVPEPYGLRFEPRELTFSRRLTKWHWLQLAILAMVVLGAASTAGYYVWMNLWAPLRGTLYIDRLGSGQVGEYAFNRRRNRVTIRELPLETQLAKLIVRARRGHTPGIIVTAVNHRKRVLLRERTLIDRGQTMLGGIPYILKYRA